MTQVKTTESHYYTVRFEVVTTTLTFWVETPCTLVGRYQHFGRNIMSPSSGLIQRLCFSEIFVSVCKTSGVTPRKNIVKLENPGTNILQPKGSHDVPDSTLRVRKLTLLIDICKRIDRNVVKKGTGKILEHADMLNEIQRM
jgi:hypothetical protein